MNSDDRHPYSRPPIYTHIAIVFSIWSFIFFVFNKAQPLSVVLISSHLNHSYPSSHRPMLSFILALSLSLAFYRYYHSLKTLLFRQEIMFCCVFIKDMT